MAATTELEITISGPSDKTHAYGSIETLDGTTITDADLLTVSINGSVLTLTTDYTVDTTNQNIIIDAGYTVAASDLLVIARSTNIDTPYVDFTNNTVVDADDLDLALKQTRFRLQELITAVGDYLEYSTVNAYWDGLSRTTSNFLPAATSTGLTTLSQVSDLIAGVSTASIDNVTEWTFTPSSPTTTFNLTSAPAGITSGKELMVWINGVHQRNTVGFAFTAGSPPSITTASLTTGDTVHILAFSGTVSTTFADGSIATAAIADNAITVDKINVGTGVNKRALVFDTSGDPTARVLTHEDISDFDTGVQSNKLNELAVPTSAMNFNGQAMNGVPQPTSGGQAANKTYVDNTIASNATNMYTFTRTVSNGAPYSVDVGFAPLTCLCADTSGNRRFAKLESGDTITLPSETVSASGTTITVTRTAGGTVTNFAVTVFG